MADLDWCISCATAISPKRYTVSIAAPPPQPGGLARGTGRVKPSKSSSQPRMRTVIDQGPTPLYCSDACRLADTDEFVFSHPQQTTTTTTTTALQAPQPIRRYSNNSDLSDASSSSRSSSTSTSSSRGYNGYPRGSDESLASMYSFPPCPPTPPPASSAEAYPSLRHTPPKKLSSLSTGTLDAEGPLKFARLVKRAPAPVQTHSPRKPSPLDGLLKCESYARRKPHVPKPNPSTQSMPPPPSLSESKESRPECSWSYDNMLTYPILDLPIRKEKQIINGKEVEVDIYAERKRLFLFPGP